MLSSNHNEKMLWKLSIILFHYVCAILCALHIMLITNTMHTHTYLHVLVLNRVARPRFSFPSTLSRSAPLQPEYQRGLLRENSISRTSRGSHVTNPSLTNSLTTHLGTSSILVSSHTHTSATLCLYNVYVHVQLYKAMLT